jgi:Tfp pilus assembly protein PilF
VGKTFQALGLYERAQPRLERAIAMRGQRLGPEHPETMSAVHNLASLFLESGNLAEAKRLLRQNMEDRRRLSGTDHPDTLSTVGNLADVLMGQGKLAEAESLFRQNLEALRGIGDPDDTNNLNGIVNLAGVLIYEKKYAEAETLLRQSLGDFRLVFGPDHPDTLNVELMLACLLQEQGQLSEAKGIAREALRRGRGALPREHGLLADILALLGNLLTRTGRAAEAEPLLREALECCRKSLPAGHPLTTQAESLLGVCLTAQQKYVEAEACWLAVYLAPEKAEGTSPSQRAQACARLVQLYEAWGKKEQADAWRKKLRAGTSSPQRAHWLMTRPFPRTGSASLMKKSADRRNRSPRRGARCERYSAEGFDGTALIRKRVTHSGKPCKGAPHESLPVRLHSIHTPLQEQSRPKAASGGEFQAAASTAGLGPGTS